MKRRINLVLLNVYSPPNQRIICDLTGLLARAKAFAVEQKAKLVITGDVNATQQAWGYATTTKKGWELWQAVESNKLTLFNDPSQPTKQGNSVSRETSPDLTIGWLNSLATWHNTQKTLGSDYCIL